jgi:hypothetical protein
MRTTGSGTRNDDDHGRETTTWSVAAESDGHTEQGRGATTALVEGRVRLAQRKSRQSSGRQAYAHRPIRPPLTAARRSPATGAWDSNTSSCVFERVTAAWVNVRC